MKSITYSKILRFNEFLWLIFGIIAIGISGYSIIIKNQEQAIYFIVLTLICGIFYSFKKRMRKRYEAREKEGRQV